MLKILCKSRNVKIYFQIGYRQNLTKKGFACNKVKNTVIRTNAIEDLDSQTFLEQKLQKTTHTHFRIEYVIKNKDDMSYVKWKGFDDSFNSWIKDTDIL